MCICYTCIVLDTSDYDIKGRGERKEREKDRYIYINENLISATFCGVGGGGGYVDGRSIEPIELARRKYTVHIDTLET